ncbi:MAG: hypothetical protein WCI02_09325 [Planctomycetota bacterium]|jgi:hypothetical protein
MPLSTHQTEDLVRMIVTVEPDAIGCDECFGRVAEYADWQLSRQEIPEGMRAIENHLRQCPCCRDEYRALLDGLEAIDWDTR